MARETKQSSEEPASAPVKTSTRPSCFIMMPISDQEGYPAGHFAEVYESIIVPAVEACGYAPIRADQVSATNLIHLDILRRIVDAPMTICDLSAANPNVMFELGIRQAFDKPVVLIKDKQTRKIFDIDTMRTIGYDADLRPRTVANAITNLSKAIEETRDANPEEGLNSIVGLLGLHAAALKRQDEDPVSARVAIFDSALSEIKYSINRLQSEVAALSSISVNRSATIAPQGLSALGQDYPERIAKRTALAEAIATTQQNMGLLDPNHHITPGDALRALGEPGITVKRR